MGFKPLHDWALIRRDEPQEKTAGGIIIPDTAKDKPAQGVVLAVGPGKFVKEKGKKEKKFVATVLQPGQRVMFIDYMAKDVEVGSETVTLIREDDILGTVEGRGELAVKPHYHLEAKEDRPPMVRDKAETEKKAPEKKGAAPAIAAGKKKASTSGKAVEKTVSKKKAPLKTAKAAGKKATTKKATPAKAKAKTKAKTRVKVKTAKPSAKKKAGKPAAKKMTPAKAKAKVKTAKPATKKQKSTPKTVVRKVTKKAQKAKARPKR